jgi:hypothetical protein
MQFDIHRSAYTLDIGYGILCDYVISVHLWLLQLMVSRAQQSQYSMKSKLWIITFFFVVFEINVMIAAHEFVNCCL